MTLNEQPPTDDRPHALEAIGLSKRYRRGTWALRGISLGIEAGRITALVGPNAAGKSTLLKTWVGFERPTGGLVRVQGLDPWRSRSAALERMAYLPQTPALYRDLTIEDHLAIVTHYRPTFEGPTARKWLARLGISPTTRPRELSGGQVAQVGLAIALGSHVPILLLDEPLASLDPLARHEFLEVLREAAATDHSTVVLSSHIVGDIAQVCDWIIVLGAGLVSLDSSVTDALARHYVVQSNGVRDGRDHLIGPLPDGRVVMARNGHERDGAATLEEIVLAYLAQGRFAADRATALAP